jgi:hypothetical protein
MRWSLTQPLSPLTHFILTAPDINSDAKTDDYEQIAKN